MFYPLSLLLITLIPSVVTASNALPVVCEHFPGIHVPDANHCSILLDELPTYDWFTRRTTYGNFAPQPGTTPKAVGYESCAFRIVNRPDGPQHGQNERIRLADYTTQLEVVVRRCLSAGRGFNIGTFGVGNRKRFFVIMGGLYIHSPGGVNGTLVERRAVGAGGEVDVQELGGDLV